VPEHHKVPVVKIDNIQLHSNADKLDIIKVFDYQAVVPKGQFKTGDLGYYIFPDSVVPQTDEFKFLWEGRGFEGEVPVKYRRIKAKKLRGEWSEGLLMPVPDNQVYEVGSDLAEFLGITHYEPPEPTNLAADCEKGPSYGRRWPHSFKGWFFFLLRKATFNYFDKYGTTDSGRERGPNSGLPVYDVEALKAHQHAFELGEEVVITEKIHGSNARYVFIDGKMWAGSRKLWKKESSGCIWRKGLQQNPWIETWCRQNPGYAIYGEITPTQDGYNYGNKPGEIRFFVFDVRKPDDTWVDWIELKRDPRYEPVLNNWVPILDERLYQEATVKSLSDGPSKVAGANHRREGIVVKPVFERQLRHLGRVQLKVVSNEFLNSEK
jgi:hypothetical protein